MITIKEIAEKAGVSATTVSNVLHGNAKKVSPQMIEKIKNLLAEYNYIPRFGLSALTSRSSKMIGILITTPEFVEETLYEKPFYGNVLETLEKIFRQQGYYIMVLSSKNIDEVMRMALGWNVEGLISVTMPKKYCQLIGKMTSRPVVSIDMDVNNHAEAEDCYNVTSQDFEAGEMVVRYLHQKGIQEIIYVANVKRGADYRRYQGAVAAYYKYYYKKSLDLIILAHSYEDRSSQYQKMAEYAGTEKRSAIIFSTALNAAEAIGCFTRAGIRLPEELSIVGMDDDIYSRLTVPSLTTVRTASSKKASCAAQMLLDILNEQPVQQKNQSIEIEFVERESVF